MIYFTTRYFNDTVASPAATLTSSVDEANKAKEAEKAKADKEARNARFKDSMGKFGENQKGTYWGGGLGSAAGVGIAALTNRNLRNKLRVKYPHWKPQQIEAEYRRLSRKRLAIGGAVGLVGGGALGHTVSALNNSGKLDGVKNYTTEKLGLKKNETPNP